MIKNLSGMVNTIIKKTLYVEPGLLHINQKYVTHQSSNSHGFNNWKNNVRSTSQNSLCTSTVTRSLVQPNGEQTLWIQGTFQVLHIHQAWLSDVKEESLFLSCRLIKVLSFSVALGKQRTEGPSSVCMVVGRRPLWPTDWLTLESWPSCLAVEQPRTAHVAFLNLASEIR